MKLRILFLGFLAFFIPTNSHAADPLSADEILAKTREVYKTASSFSCDAELDGKLETAIALEDHRAAKIFFARPDKFRMEWTEIQLGGKKITSSIFTKNNVLYFYWGLFDKYKKVTSIRDVIGEAAGISHSLSYELPSLLLGEKNVWNSWKWERLADTQVDNRKCYCIKGAKNETDQITLDIDQSTHLVFRNKQRTLVRPSQIHKEIEETRKKIEKDDPALAKRLANSPNTSAMPDFYSSSTVTYLNVSLNKPLSDEDFLFKIPSTAKLSESIP